MKTLFLTLSLILVSACSSSSLSSRVANVCQAGKCKADMSCCSNACGKCKGDDSCMKADCNSCTTGKSCKTKHKKKSE